MPSASSQLTFGASIALIALVGGCSRDSGDSGNATGDTDDTGSSVGPAPTVLSTTPLDAAVAQPLNLSVSATFSELMDPLSLSPTTFGLSAGDPAVAVDGTVIYADSTATFWPAAHLDLNTEYTALVDTGARSAAGQSLAEDYSWTFTTGASLAPGLPVDLGTAGNFAILAKSGISNVPTSAITGNIGVSPAAATYITGFSLTADATNEFSTSPQVIGNVYAADYAVPTPSDMTTAIGDMERAFVDAAGRAPDTTELGAGNVGGLTLAPGVYRWGTGLLIPTDLTLDGDSDAVWIFQIAQDLTLGNGARVELAGGAVPENVFWQVSGLVDVGTTAHLAGVLVAQTSVSLRTGATVDGRLLAQTAVDIDGATVTVPAP